MRTMGSKYGGDVEAVKAQASEVVYKVQVHTSTDDVMEKIAEMLNTGGVKGDGGGKPVRELETIQQLRNFAGDRSKFREWNEKLLNALGQVHIGNRKALKLLNSKLESLDGALNDTGEDDIVRILNGRLTQAEYDDAKAPDRLIDDNKGDNEFSVKLKRRLDEALVHPQREARRTGRAREVKRAS